MFFAHFKTIIIIILPLIFIKLKNKFIEKIENVNSNIFFFFIKN